MKTRQTGPQGGGTTPTVGQDGRQGGSAPNGQGTAAAGRGDSPGAPAAHGRGYAAAVGQGAPAAPAMRPKLAAAAPRTYDIFIGNVGYDYNADNIKEVIQGVGIEPHLIKIQEIGHTKAGSRKAFKATVPFAHFSDVTVALMCCDDSLIVEKFNPAKQQTSTRRGGYGGRPGPNNFRGPRNRSYQQNPQQRQQYQPNYPGWFGPSMPVSHNWSHFGPPSGPPHFGPSGWGNSPSN